MKFGKRVIYRVINGLLQPRMSILCPLLIKLQAENLEELCKTMGISTWRIKNKKGMCVILRKTLSELLIWTWEI